jgi:hypothetical protein
MSADLGVYLSGYLPLSKRDGHVRKAMSNRWINRRCNTVNVNYRASSKSMARAPWRRITWNSR